MKKAVLAIAAAATIAAGTLTAPTPADARCRGACAVGIGLGVLGAAALGSAIARGGYVVYEGYDRPYPYRCHRGYWARQRLYDRYGSFVGWSEPHFVCRERW